MGARGPAKTTKASPGIRGNKLRSGVRSPTGHRTLEQAQATSYNKQSDTDKKKNRNRTKDRRAAIKTGRVSRGDGKDLDHIKGNAKGATRVVAPSKNRALRGQKNGRSKAG